MSQAMIHTRGLEKSYVSDSGRVAVLRGLDLAVEEGELAVLMGSSGSGKSTLLHVLSGLESVSAGEIHFGGERVDAMNETELSVLRRTSIGFVFQAINLVPHLTLLENVALAGYLVEPRRQKVDERAMELLDSMAVGELADRLPAQVSGGEQQRVAIARALINRPRAVLADEPTGALNSAASRTVLDAFRQINRQGQTVLMATHEVRAACIGDRILYMRDGRVQAEHRPASAAAGEDARESQVVDWLVSQGW